MSTRPGGSASRGIGALTVLPVGTVVSWVFGAASWLFGPTVLFDVPLTPLTALLMSLAVGLRADDTF